MCKPSRGPGRVVQQSRVHRLLREPIPEQLLESGGFRWFALPEEVAERRFRFVKDAHWNAAGHRRVAEILEPVLLDWLGEDDSGPSSGP